MALRVDRRAGADDKGEGACSFYFPDGKRIVWTSTRDWPDLPRGNWSDPRDYPKGAEIYTSKPDGSDVKRLTNNRLYEAEVSVSPDGRFIYYAQRNGTFTYNAQFPLWQVYRHDRETGDVSQVTNARGSAMRPSISPDGKWKHCTNAWGESGWYPIERLGKLGDVAIQQSHEEFAYLPIAFAEYGTREIPGSGSNPRIQEYIRSTDLAKYPSLPDETDWCACADGNAVTPGSTGY